MPSELGMKIDSRYEVLGELGRGGMGVVYKANDLRLDRLVAIKVMTSHIAGRDESLERFLREAKSIAKMQHPNIVVVHDYGYHGDAPYIAMEYVEGMPLDKLIASRANLSLFIKVQYIVQVCHALHYAHQSGIVHRDVKPGNIMVLENGTRVKLLDFGIARAGSASSLSKSGLAMGTTCYMSPEQTKGQKDLDARADIFSTGVVLYELLTGTPPWTGGGDYEIMTKIIHDPYPPLSTRLRNYPAGLDQVLERALAKEANARYQTAEKMASELSELETSLKEQVLEDALFQFEQGDLLRARDLVSQILRVDTRHREALELSQKLQQISQLHQRSERVQQLRQAAEQAIGQKQYQEALGSIEQAISIDSANSELFHYRDLIRQELKRREDIRKRLELAKKAQEMNDLSSAQELVEKALEADPTDTHARMMKSALEQEKKRQQLQEFSDEAKRALAARAFVQAKRWIQEIEAVDLQFPLLASLRKALADAEAEEKRQAEIEDLIRDIRQVLKTGDVTQSLNATEAALVKFPGELRLARLRTQAESLRDVAQRERSIQEQIAAINKLAEQGRAGEALAAAERALQSSGADHRLQAAVTQLRQNIQRERLDHTHQEILARAREAMRVADYESAIQILTPARIDFPASREIAEALRNAQEALAQQAADRRSQNALRDAAQRERAIQEQIAAINKLAEQGRTGEALAAAERALQSSAGDHRLQAAVTQLRDNIERERRDRSYQEILARVREAMRAANYESAIQILTPARIDFPASKEIAEALRSAQEALAQKAADRLAENARKRQVADALERALAAEPDPGAQVRLAEDAARSIPGNDWVDQVLVRVRERHKQVSSAMERARSAEHNGNYAEALREWENVRQLYPQYPQLQAQIARLAAALQNQPSKAPDQPATPLHFSATSIMAAKAVLKPAPPAAEPVSAPVSAPQPTVATQSDGKAVIPRKIVWAGVGVAVVTVALIAFIAFRPGKHEEPTRARIASETNPGTGSSKVEKPPGVPQPALGKLSVETNLDQVDVLVDGDLKAVTEGRTITVAVSPGSHTVAVRKSSFAASPQSVEITKDQESTLHFMLNRSDDSTQSALDTYLMIKTHPGATVRIDRRNEKEVPADGNLSIKTAPGPHQIDVTQEGFEHWSKIVNPKAGDRVQVPADLKAIPKPPTITSFAVSPPSIQEGDSVELKWETQNATEVMIDNIGKVDPNGSTRVTPKGIGTIKYTLQANGEGMPGQRTITVNVAALPKPVIGSFEAGTDKIQLGRPVKLFWSTQNATEVFITADPGPDIGKMSAEGFIVVSPTKSTTYILTAKGPGGIAPTRQISVTVEVAPTSAVVATASPVSTPPPENPDAKAIKDILAQYKNAWHFMDIDALRRIWPTMPSSTEKDVRKVFNAKDIKAVDVELKCDDLVLKNDTAEYSCQETYTWKYENRKQTPAHTSAIFDLRKIDGAWRITNKR